MLIVKNYLIFLHKISENINTKIEVGKIMKKIIFLGILVFIVSVGVGFVYTRMFYDTGDNQQSAQLELNNIEDYGVQNYTKLQTLEASSEDEKLSPNAKFAIKEFYDECGHFNFKYHQLPAEIVNMSRQEIEDYYDEYEVEEFDNNNLVLTKEINGLCNEHFFVTLGNEHIEVMKLNADGSFSPYQETDISREYLPEEDIKQLEEGIYVYGSGKINSVIEDYE